MNLISSKTKVIYQIQILTVLFLSLPLMGACRREESASLTCLPESRQLTDVVSIEGDNQLKKVTISDKLEQLQARCENNLLVDGEGTEIRFYNLRFVCGGAAPLKNG